uniref:uncharacterized protein LOC122601580 n=1 Tax=Erigeron canadensis TaxID=72917 RepID=UPI001CB92C28|nr:uncharacterized protein LOC122601580 [Erigeron canadensis]
MVMDHHVTKQTKSTTTKKSKHGGIDHQLLSSTTTTHHQNKKTKKPGRGLGVAQLEQIRIRTEQVEKTKSATSLHYHQYPLQNGVVPFSTTQNQHHYHQQQLIPLTNNSPPAAAVPQIMFSGTTYGPNNHVFMDHNNVQVHYPINSNPGYRFDNRSDMFSSAHQNYVKYCGGSDACGTCYKKKRINNMIASNNNNNQLNTLNQFRYGLNNVIDQKVDYTGQNHLCFSPQVREVMPGYRRVRYGMAEYEFFPGKGAGETTSSRCVSGTERGGGGMIGSHGGEGSSCVTAVTSTNEEGSVCCSVDLSLKL